MPLIRRVPKRGFFSRSHVTNQVVNLRDLGRISSDEVNPATLLASSLIAGAGKPVKILGFGAIDRAVVVRGCAVSKTARVKIEQAGGRIEA